MKFIDEFKIKGFQNIQQYLKINPINIQTIDSQIQNKFLFYVNKYKYRFIVNSLLFSSSIQKDTNAIFITTNGLNNTNEILINGKLVQGIGLIFTSEIEDWKNTKKTSDCVNVVLTDSRYPIVAKQFGFAFETTDLDNILNLEYSLLDDQGKLIEFKTREDKIPALNFIIQIVNENVEGKKKIYNPSNKTKDEVSQLQNDVKNYIRKVHLDNKKKTKLLTNMRA